MRWRWQKSVYFSYTSLFQHHHIAVVQQFSANPALLSATVRLATVADLRTAIPLLQVQPGEGCLLYATSHGTREGLTLARDAASGYRLRPTQLHQVVQAACGAAPTILVLSRSEERRVGKEGS